MRSTFFRICLYGFVMAVLVCSASGSAFAIGPTPAAPEIDGSALTAGLAAASAAVLILRSRRRSK